MGSRVNREDKLSNLPGSILVYILSFLPTVDAVRTMLIKKSFVGLWTSLPILDLEDFSFNYSNIFDDDNDEKGSSSMRDLPFFNFVRNVLSRHTRPKTVKFRVNIDQVMYYEIEDWNLRHELESWISFALRKQVEVLDFGVGLMEPFFEICKWPHPEFASDFLVELRLEYVNVDSLTQVKMGLLRILRLIRVEVTDSIFELIICGCPLLEEVQIYNCDLSMLNLSTVKKLILDVNELSSYYTEDDNFQQVVKINGQISDPLILLDM